MKQAAPAVRNLARLLLSTEANQRENSEEELHAVLNVIEKFRIYLSKLVGVTGFQVMLVRALALAKHEKSWLGEVRVQADATLEGYRETALHLPKEAIEEGSIALMAQLLGLLIIFIGEALTLRLVMDVWPEAQLGDIHLGVEETRHE